MTESRFPSEALTLTDTGIEVHFKQSKDGHKNKIFMSIFQTRNLPWSLGLANSVLWLVAGSFRALALLTAAQDGGISAAVLASTAVLERM